jgi:hypothetical protein
VKPNDEPQESGFAGAIGSQQTKHAPALEFKRDVVQSYVAVLVDLGELNGLNHRIIRSVFRHGIPSSPSTTPPWQFPASSLHSSD